MRTTTRSTRLQPLLAVLAVLLALLLLAGCASSSGDRDQSLQDSTTEYEAPAPESGYAEEAAPESGDAAATDTDVGPAAERDIITTTSATIRVEDVPGTLGVIEQLVVKHDGRIEARDERTADEVPEAFLTVRIPAASNDAFITEMKDLGTVMQLESSAVDVTLAVVDLESRIDSLQSSIASLRGMLEEATTVEDMLAVERELSDRETELQSLTAQYEVLAEDVAYSTVYIALSTDADPQPIDEPTGFWAGLVSGWNAFVESLTEFITGLGYAIPGLILIALILLALWFFVVRPIWRAIRRQYLGRPGQSAPTPETSETGAASPGTDNRGTHTSGTHTDAVNTRAPNTAAATTGGDRLPPLPQLDSDKD